jgi:hypothetical protein
MRQASLRLVVLSLVSLSALALACERMEPSGNPFAPVEVAASASATRAHAQIPGDEWDFPAERPLVVSSDQLGRGGASINMTTALGGSVASAPRPQPAAPTLPSVVAATDGGIASAGTSAPLPAAPTPAVLPEKTEDKSAGKSAAAIPAGTSTATATAAPWPIRLVATVPGAQPPRAILGMPDGTEKVVTPGSLLPEAGIVVVAVGKRTVDVAQIRPAGDHAEIRSLTLHAQE